MSAWVGVALLAAALIAPSSANATSFSFGDIDATDTITAIRLAADTGGDTVINFTTVDDKLVIEASVVQIDFANKANITGIPTGDLLFTAQLTMTGAPLFLPVGNPFPTFTAASFDDGPIDWSIWDLGGGGGPVSVLEADFSSTLDFSANDDFLLQGELTGDYGIIGGDSDAQAAFGPAGNINASLNFGTVPLCGTLAACPAPTDYIDWEANPTMTLLPVAVPEPGTLVLLSSSLALALAWGRRPS